jgi:CheY-like chemotaxis protein
MGVNTQVLGVASMGRILVVDDDPDSIEPVCTFLRRSGHTVESVFNGQEALARIIEHRPDLIVLDVFMPQLDGCSLLQILRSYLRLQSLPVIVYTGAADSPMVDRARQLRVGAVLTKGTATLSEIGDAVTEELSRASA